MYERFVYSWTMIEWIALTRPPLFKCKIINKVGQQLGAEHQIRFAFIWGMTFSDLVSFGAQHFLICLHLGRAFLPKAFLIGSADFFNEMWTDTYKMMCDKTLKDSTYRIAWRRCVPSFMRVRRWETLQKLETLLVFCQSCVVIYLKVL